MQWYYSKNSTQLGPVSLDELRAKIASGEVSGNEMAWREGFPDWKRIGEIPELVISSAGLRQVPVAPQAGGVAPSSPYAPPVYPGGMVAPVRTSGLAIASLVCGIMGLFCMLLPGIAGVICGHLALKEIANSSQRIEGRGMAIAGLITGYLSVLILMFWILAAFIGIASETLR